MNRTLRLATALLVLTLLSTGCAKQLRAMRTPGTVTCSSVSQKNFSSTTCYRVKADGGLETILRSTGNGIGTVTTVKPVKPVKTCMTNLDTGVTTCELVG